MDRQRQPIRGPSLALLATALLLVALGIAAASFYLLSATPLHSDAGWGVGLALLAIGVIVVELGTVGLGAWWLWRRDYKMMSQLVGVACIASVVMAFKVVSAANLVLDTSEPIEHPVSFVEFVSNAGTKQASYVLVTSWREPGVNAALELPLNAQHFVPGKPLIVTTHAGAFGREYAVDIRAAP